MTSGGIEKALCVAMTRQLVMGNQGRLPWNLPEELKLFRELTWGHSVIMGRGTFTAIGHPLPGRRNVILSSTLAPQPGTVVCRNLEEALTVAAAGMTRIFFIGGAEIYRQALPRVDTLYISWIRGDFPGDIHFPPFDPRPWRVRAVSEHPGFRQVIYERGVRPARPARP